MVDAATFRKAMDYQEYVRACKLEEHNRRLKRPEFAQGCKRKAERLEAQYPDFKTTYAKFGR